MITIRAFIGIEFDQECKKRIYDLQQKLRKLAIKGRWKHSDNFHLTLKFLDEINAQQQKQINETLEGICREHSQFRLEIGDLGVFNSGDAIRVLWLGLAGDLPQLHTLSEEIDRSLAQFGFEPEKRSYTPHITIGQEILFEIPFDQIRQKIGYEGFGPVNVKSITLFKSEQLQNKRVYAKMSGYALTKKA